ncbi:armadillo repeat-containing protein 3-like isoform X1 [Octopus sinensis]|uniref:Armadillo repeat-containing protein 3-like isoform X1 n=1 Tax=Octopus sinensis TaxID=2607531 RepID=A0A7E6FBF3_9MOLL|nr:armadillo repeat-containing protein 3-like isoform X1 [Octopus sinensis]
MVKKGKKEDKLPAEDFDSTDFDPILIESRQAGTAVLMLASSEADVQAHACEAIYKFVVKNEENKKTLLELNACEPLLELMKNEDRIVHRNALAALATMCAHPDVRKVLRKRKDCVPTFISLLQSEEETVVLEFASLGLNYLSTEYVSKVEMLNSQAFEPLIHCLSHHDPDVQKNSVEALSQLVLNYQCQRVMKELNGFPPVLELLKSEYAIIQRLALLVLERCSHDVENRIMLRELDIVNKMIFLIGHPDWPDLHIMAVMVLSNMMEDIETVETFKEGLGLRKLIALITDQTPPEEEVQPKKGDKKSSKSGKKGKEVKSVKEEEVTSPAVDTVFPLLPDVKCAVTKAIGRAARNAESRKILHELEVEKMLITLLSHENSSIQAAAANTLAVMCENLTCRQAVLDCEGFLPLIRLLRSDNGETLQAVTLVLRYLTTANLSSCLEVSKSHGIGPLIHLLEDSNESAVSNAAAVLTNLALHESLRQDVKQKGVVSALVKALRFVNNKATQSQVLLALANYASSPLSRDELRNANGIEPVVKLLKSEDKDVVKNAAWAIYVSAADEATAHEICICGGLNTLQEINLNPTRRNQFTAAALERLFDNNLSAKFSFCGYLSPTNIITDGFFYAGRLKLNAQFKSLEELNTQKMKDRKPIIVINAKFEAPAKEDEKQEDINSRVFKFKRDVRPRNQKERIEKGKEDEESIITTGEDKPATVIECEEKSFVLPEDTELGAYVDEINKELTNMSGFLERITTLAKFVSNKMGGAVSREQYGNFSWELPLSQLQHEHASNIISIGSIKYGNQFHRALLFKVLADRVVIRCSLVHGDFFKAWNIVLLGNEEAETVGQKNDSSSPLKAYIVDVIHEPGRLILVDTPEAIRYCTM